MTPSPLLTRVDVTRLPWDGELSSSAFCLDAGHVGIDSKGQDNDAYDQEARTELVMAERKPGEGASDGKDEAQDRPNDTSCSVEHTSFLLKIRRNEAFRAAPENTLLLLICQEGK